ncbi:MAG: hypothetical protein JNL36_04735 [Candidatus Kapabacteria bacterium]|nr:hypothetical protein [Candidatus Kapabacteria bacterium]
MHIFSKLFVVVILLVCFGCVGLKTSRYTYVGTWDEENYGTQLPLRNGRGSAKMSFYPDYRVEGFITDSLFLEQYMVSGSWRDKMVNLIITRHPVKSIGEIFFSADSNLVLVRYYNNDKMYRGQMKLTRKIVADSLLKK